MAEASVRTLEDCLNLLRGNTDEQRLVGLLLATKFVQGDDTEAVVKVFDAIGIQFIDRLLKSGRGDALVSIAEAKQEQPYLQLALTILAAFCRVPELASLDDTISKIPVIVQTLAENQQGSIAVECYECLLGIALGSEKGLVCVQESRALSVITRHLFKSYADAAWINLAVKLMHILLAKGLAEIEIAEYAEDLALAVPTLAEQLAYHQSSVKFDVLALFCSLVTSDMLVPVRAALKRNRENSFWLANLRTGIGQILQSRVAADQKHLAMGLVKAMVELYGTSWLLGTIVLPGEANETSMDRFFILLVETIRIETAVILNELARMRFDSGNADSCTSQTMSKKQHILATCYVLMEYIMNAIIVEPDDPYKMSETTLDKTMIALNETIGLVFELLQDAKSHGVTKGDDLLASVRLVGRFLADAPTAYQKQFLQLLQYIFSVTAEDEERPLLAIHFLLPALSQITMEIDGCKSLASWKGHKQIIDYILLVNSTTGHGLSGLMVEACDILINILQQKNKIRVKITASDFLGVLQPLAIWAKNSNKSMEIALAACICSLVLDLTNESDLLNNVELNPVDDPSSVFIFISKSLEQYQQSECLEEPTEEDDLWDITISTCSGLMDRYPSLKSTISSSAWVEQLLQNGNLNEKTINPSLRILIASITTDST